MAQCKEKPGIEASAGEITARCSLAKNSNLHLRLLILLIHIDTEVTELLDQVLQIFRLDLSQVEWDTLLVHCDVGAMQGLRRNQSSQFDASAQQLHWDSHIHPRRTIVPAVFFRVHFNPQILR